MANKAAVDRLGDTAAEQVVAHLTPTAEAAAGGSAVAQFEQQHAKK